MSDVPVLAVEDLRVEIEGRGVDIVDELSFTIGAGEVLGVVGESGSGKSTVGLAVLGHTRRGARIVRGSIRIDGENLLEYPSAKLRSLRGRMVAHVPQDPGAALNPALRIGALLMEALEVHRYGSSALERRARLAEVLREVALPTDQEFLRRYPHQLSGGQQQRVALAIAFSARPRVIVMDEPTTGLDVTTQAHVLQTVHELCRQYGVAALYVSHDLAVVARLADRVAVMYAGRMVELGPDRLLARAAAHPYTRDLLRAIPEIRGRYALAGIPGRAPAPGQRPDGCFFAPRCEFAAEQCVEAFPPIEEVSPGHTVRCWRYRDVTASNIRERAAVTAVAARVAGRESLLSVRDLRASYGPVEVVHGANLDLWPHECLALVGESGSGKTTLAKCLGGLHTSFSGQVTFAGEPVVGGVRGRSSHLRQSIQYIFQNPYSSLNPRKTILQIVSQPLDVFFGLSRRDTQMQVAEALERVSLSWRLAQRYPDQLSGGERQRVAIARALAAGPRVLISDEITSSLDVSVQAALVALLAELQRDSGIALLFVTHNLALVRTIAQEVVVLNTGSVVEFGPVTDVLDNPQQAYTRRLLADTPDIEVVSDLDSRAATSGGPW